MFPPIYLSMLILFEHVQFILSILNSLFAWEGDVFAGVGPISISAALKVKYVYANDLNPYAVDYLERNIILNKLDRKIEVSFFIL